MCLSALLFIPAAATALRQALPRPPGKQVSVILKSKLQHSHPRSIPQSSSFKQDEFCEPKIEPHQPDPLKSPSSSFSFPTLVLCMQFSPAVHHLAALLQWLVVLTLSILDHKGEWIARGQEENDRNFLTPSTSENFGCRASLAHPRVRRASAKCFRSTSGARQ